MSFSRGSSWPRSSALQVDCLSSEPPGKPKNIGVGSLSLPRNWTGFSYVAGGFFFFFFFLPTEISGKPQCLISAFYHVKNVSPSPPRLIRHKVIKSTGSEVVHPSPAQSVQRFFSFSVLHLAYLAYGTDKGTVLVSIQWATGSGTWWVCNQYHCCYDNRGSC